MEGGRGGGGAQTDSGSLVKRNTDRYEVGA